MRRASPIFSLLPLFAACAPSAEETGLGLEDNGWVPYCEESRAVITADEVTALGFSAQEILDFAALEHAATLEHTTGDVAAMTLNVRHLDSDIEYVTLTEATPPEDAGSIAAIAVICDDYVSIPVSIDAASDDGALDVTWSVTLTALSTQRADFSFDEAVEAYEDGFDLAGLDRGDLDREVISISGAFSPEMGATGEIMHVSEGSDEQTAWQAMVQLAAWSREG